MRDITHYFYAFISYFSYFYNSIYKRKISIGIRAKSKLIKNFLFFLFK